MREGPSKEADEMHNWLFDGIYNRSVQLIAEGRKVDEAKAKQWIDTALYSADAAKDADDARVAVAGVQDRDAGGEIQEASPIRRVEISTLAPLESEVGPRIGGHHRGNHGPGLQKRSRLSGFTGAPSRRRAT